MVNFAARRKRARAGLIVVALGFVVTAVILATTALEETIVFFVSPTELAEGKGTDRARIRIGGLVEAGSVVRSTTSAEVRFNVTDMENSITVAFVGILPDLFREGQGVVADGRMLPGGLFRADEVLARHDETYVPPEVAAALKASGHWREGEPIPKPSEVNY